jgi:hypothetical protein
MSSTLSFKVDKHETKCSIIDRLHIDGKEPLSVHVRKGIWTLTYSRRLDAHGISITRSTATMVEEATNPSPVKGVCKLLQTWGIGWEYYVSHTRPDHSKEELQEDASWGLWMDPETPSCINHSCTTGYPESNADLLICRQDSAVCLLATCHVVRVNLGGHGFTHHVVDALILVTSAPKHAKEASSIKTAEPQKEEVTKSSGVDSSFVGSSPQLAKNAPFDQSLEAKLTLLYHHECTHGNSNNKGCLVQAQESGLERIHPCCYSST